MGGTIQNVERTGDDFGSVFFLGERVSKLMNIGGAITEIW